MRLKANFLLAILFATVFLLNRRVEGGVARLKPKNNSRSNIKGDFELSAEAKAAIERASQPRAHTPRRTRVPLDKVEKYDHHRKEEFRAIQGMQLSDHALNFVQKEFQGEKRKQNENKIFNARKGLHERVYFHGMAADAILKKVGHQ